MKKFYQFVWLIAFVLMAGAMLPEAFGQQPDYVIITEADTWINGGDQADIAHGADTDKEHTILVVKNEGDPGASRYWRESLLRFDLSAVTEEIGMAVLKLWSNGKNSTYSDSFKLVYACSFIPDDNWNEKTVTWNTAPLPDFSYELQVGDFYNIGTQQDSVIEKGVTVFRKLYGWTIGGKLKTDIVERERKGDKKISIDMWGKTKKLVWSDPDTWISFVARDSVGADSLHPRLLIWKKGNEPTWVSDRSQGAQVYSYALGPNYPNPFNPATTIQYAIKEAGRATLTIFNVLGQPIRTFDQIAATPGWHQLHWDGLTDQGLVAPAGIYFYQLRAGDFIATRKMVLTK
ncbi:MAG: DNRLRE domain-containing protein [candidate division KSB1 bacterium]|nr:DNRLRE domain-containing protein [candidate division KSB1 bacterium]